MQIGICDDEIFMLEIIRLMIEDYCHRHDLEAEIYLYASGAELLSMARDLDLLFLDIQMPGMDGIEAGKLLRKKNRDCKIIISSGYEERMKDTFCLEAFCFLSKPFQADEFEAAMRTFEESRVGYQTIELYETRQPVWLRQRDIIYIQTYDSYTEFMVKDRMMRSEKSLRDLEEELDRRLFFRVNKKYIVNYSYIDAYEAGNIHIHGIVIPVSRRRKKDFEQGYREYDLRM